MIRWLLSLVSWPTFDPAWRATGVKRTQDGPYDFAKAVAGKRRAEARAKRKRAAEAAVTRSQSAQVIQLRRRSGTR